MNNNIYDPFGEELTPAQELAKEIAEIVILIKENERAIKTHQNLINRYFFLPPFTYFKKYHEDQINKLTYEIAELSNKERELTLTV